VKRKGASQHRKVNAKKGVEMFAIWGKAEEQKTKYLLKKSGRGRQGRGKSINLSYFLGVGESVLKWLKTKKKTMKRGRA